MRPAKRRGPAASERVAFAHRLADDCRRLASTEHEAPVAALFEKLARLFDEAAAHQRWQGARPGFGDNEFDTWY
jgi:hypothetical protein